MHSTVILSTAPVEILLKIFLMSSIQDQDQQAKTLIRLACVCRRWRGILLDYPIAWTTLSLARQEVAELMLFRSKAELVTLHIEDTQGGSLNAAYMGVARYTLSHAQGRIRELSIITNKFHHAAQLLMMIHPINLPRLELLALRGLQPGRHVFSLFPTHFSGAMPLRRLTLHNARLLSGAASMLQTHCGSLARLSLSTVRGMTLPALLDVLRAAQDTLQSIHLSWLEFSPEDDVAAVAPQTICLPALQKFSLEGLFPPFTDKTPTTLLPYLQYPMSTSLTVKLYMSNDDGDVPEALRAHLVARESDYRGAFISSPSKDQRGIRIRYWSTPNIPDLDDLERHSSSLLDLCVMSDVFTYDVEVVSALISLSIAANVGSLQRAIVAPLPFRLPWVRILSLMPYLRELTLYGSETLCNVHNAYTTRSWPYTSSDSTGSLFSRLTTITVSGLVLQQSVTNSIPSHASRMPSEFEALSALLSALPSLDQLCVCYCDVQPADIRSLTSLAPGVDIAWDGSLAGRASMRLPQSQELYPLKGSDFAAIAA